MAVVETLRVLKPVNVGCEKHNRIESRTLGHYAPEWMNLPYARLAMLKRTKMVEAVTVEEEELVRFEQLHEELWGSDAEEMPSELGDVSEESGEENDPDETDGPDVVEEEIPDLGPVEEVEDEEEPEEEQPKKVVPRRRTQRRTRSKT